MRTARWLGVVLLALVMDATALEVGLVTAVSGNVKLQEEKAPASELKPFVKVRAGDHVLMEGPSRLQVVYFEGGRQETWQGPTALEIGEGSSSPLNGSRQPEVRILPAILVKQLAKTPSVDGNLKTGMIRLRSIPQHDRLEWVESNYDEMRLQANASDRNPELYLLASYFELRAFEKLENLLRKMDSAGSDDPQLSALNALYSRAISEAMRAEKK